MDPARKRAEVVREVVSEGAGSNCCQCDDGGADQQRLVIAVVKKGCHG